MFIMVNSLVVSLYSLQATTPVVEPSVPVSFIDAVAWCVQDYSWEDHGFSLVNRLLPDMGQFLDEKFQV